MASKLERIAAERRKIEAIFGRASDGGSPNSRLHHGRSVRLMRDRGQEDYLPEGCSFAAAAALPVRPLVALGSVCKVQRRRVAIAMESDEGKQ